MIRPARAVTVVATSTRRRTCSPMLTTLRPRPGTITPWNSLGWLGPWSVAKDKSTTASSGNGLNRLIDKLASLSVEPVAKYQVDDADVAQGAASHPFAPLTTSSTTPPPPFRSTSAAATLVDTTSPIRTEVTERGATEEGAVLASPSVGTTVTRA